MGGGCPYGGASAGRIYQRILSFTGLIPLELLDMNALEQIIEELYNDQRSLEGPLLKTKVLASRIKNDEIKDWASRELIGYRDGRELPSYRFVRPVYEWQIRQRGEELPPAAVPRMLFDEEIRELYFRGRMDQAVKVLESLTSRTDGDGILRKDYAADICQFLTRKIKNNAQLNIWILRLVSLTDISEVVQVLSMIRSTLLDFILGLESDIPDLVKPLSSISRIAAPEQARVAQIFHNTVINVMGHGNTVVAGDNNETAPS
jgi:hypothetical protein